MNWLGRIETFHVVRLRGTKQIRFLIPEAEGNIAHLTLRATSLRESNLHFSWGWLLGVMGLRACDFLGVAKLGETEPI